MPRRKPAKFKEALRRQVEFAQPPGSTKSRDGLMLQAATQFRTQLDDYLGDPGADELGIDGPACDALAVALAQMAEDLHVDAGIWRSLEAYHQDFFGVPLPVVCRVGDPDLETFDPRRFHFFLYTVWQQFQPGTLVRPRHQRLIDLAKLASEIFATAFAGKSRQSAMADYLAEPCKWGWEVKRKLIWLGTHSYLFRFAFEAWEAGYDVDLDEDPEGAHIRLTDDFICQHCTEWSGLGVIDLLAEAMNLPEADRATLRSWCERHLAFYRVESLEVRKGQLETMEVLNLINEQSYRVQVGMDRKRAAFKVGEMVLGSLVPWRGACVPPQ